jgi:hypothetical protein
MFYNIVMGNKVAELFLARQAKVYKELIKDYSHDQSITLLAGHFDD